MSEEKQVFSVIAIDFGTTYSSVGVVQDNQIHIVSDDHGNVKIPSYVSFTDDGCVVGEDALKQVAINPFNTIYDIKRILSWNLNEIRRKTGMKYCPLYFTSDRKEAKINVAEKGKVKTCSFQEICALILIKLKKMANCYLGRNVADAVLTIPNNFNPSQIRAIIEACHIAELKVLRIISDTVAAGLSHELHLAGAVPNVLVFHLGGGTFEATVLQVRKGAFELRASTGDGHLGGEDFDVRLVKHFAEEILKAHRRDITGDAYAMRVLRAACERAKRALSDADETTLVADFPDGLSFRATLTRAHFEQLCADLFLLLFQHLENVLFVANVLRGEIDRVVLAGGATRMRKVREMIGVFFEQEIAQPVPPETAVVTGAAVQAALVQAVAAHGKGPHETSPLSIGIEAPGAVMTVIIPRQSELPVKKTVNYTTYRDYQQAITLNVFEGERLLAPRNPKLGTLTLDGLPPMPRGIPQIDITFDFDTSGLLTVTACERSTGINNRFVAITSKDHISEDQVERVLVEAEHFRQDDENERDRLLARDLFEACLLNVKTAMNAPDVVESMEYEDHSWYMHMFRAQHQWLKANLSAEKEQFMRRTVDLQILYLSVVVDMFHDDTEQELRCRSAG